jgi:hypothetical protein
MRSQAFCICRQAYSQLRNPQLNINDLCFWSFLKKDNFLLKYDRILGFLGVILDLKFFLKQRNSLKNLLSKIILCIIAQLLI